MATLPKTDLIAERIEEVTRAFVRPEGVGPPRFEFGPDQGGDNAVYLWFRVGKSVQHDPKKVRELADFSDRLTGSLYKLGTGLFFYVWFEDAKR